MRQIVVTINGRERTASVEDRLLLSDFLRGPMGLRGTHTGCEHGSCGACTIRLDGAAVRSCLLLAAQVDGCSVQTVEGLAEPEAELTTLQRAFKRHHGLQCGFCTPGILMSAAELIESGEQPTRREVEELLSGHLCRCTGYAGIVDAIMEAVDEPR